MLRNQDLFANKDSELGHTDTVKMHIDVGVNQPIKMRPYRTPIKNREVIDNRGGSRNFERGVHKILGSRITVFRL